MSKNRRMQRDKRNDHAEDVRRSQPLHFQPDASESERKDLLIFGRNAVMAYLKRMDEDGESEEHNQVNKVFLSETAQSDERVHTIKQLTKRLGIPVINCPKSKLDSMFDFNINHQGVVAQLSPVKLLELNELIDSVDGERKRREGSGQGMNGYIIVALDGVEDPRNVGAIIRSAESQGVRAILIPERRAAGVTETVAKTSAGAIAHIPIIRIVNLVKTLDSLKELGFWVMGLDAEAIEPIYKIDLIRPLVIVVGSEGKGLRPLVRQTCDLLGAIPLTGKTDSLNASVALGIAVYETMRQNTSRSV